MSLRFRIRHVHKTLADYLEAELDRLGWVTPPVNFATQPITFLEFQPDEAGKAIAANTVSITLGDEPPGEDEGMGGGLREIAYPVFVDIYGASQSVAASIASDVRDCLQGYLFVRDFTTNGGVDTAEQIELDKDDISVERPAAAQQMSDFRRNWRVVKTMARVHFIQD